MSYPDGRIDTPAESLSREDAIAKITAVVPLSADDLEGFLACSPDEQAALISAYKDAAVPVTSDMWAEVLTIMKTCIELATLVEPIAGLVSSIFGIAKLF